MCVSDEHPGVIPDPVGNTVILVEASNIAILRVPGVREPELPDGFFVEYSCTLGSEGQAQCIRTLVAPTTAEAATGSVTGFATDIASWVTSACVATTMPPILPTPTGIPAPLPKKLAASSDPSLLPCPLNYQKDSTSPVLIMFEVLGFFLFCIGVFVVGIRLIYTAIAQWHEADSMKWDAPPILHSLIYYVPKAEVVASESHSAACP
jgi:hypothetical protein